MTQSVGLEKHPRVRLSESAIDGFERLWLKIANLAPGQRIATWNYEGGYLGSHFEVAEASPRRVVIAPPGVKGLKAPRLIARADFFRVFALWTDYTSGSVARHQVGLVSQNTTYIFGIIRHVGA